MFFFVPTRDIERRTPDLRHAACRAFTLLEVILAMGIVTMLVLMIANMFQEVSQTWNIGTQSAEMNVAGRTAVEFIAQEMAQAVAGPIETAQPAPGGFVIPFHVESNRAWFVTLNGDPDRDASPPRRSLRSALFVYNRNDKILQYLCTNTNDPPDSGANQRLVENVFNFGLLVYPTTNDLIQANPLSTPYDSTAYSNKLPAAVDIYVEVLGNDDVTRHNQLATDAEKQQFAQRNGRRYTTRVYFNNRLGFLPRP